MKFILWGTLGALLAFTAYSEGTPEAQQVVDNVDDEITDDVVIDTPEAGAENPNEA